MYPGPRDEIVDQMWHQIWKYSDMEDSAARPGPIASTAPLTDEWRDRVLERVIDGSAEEIIDTVGALREQVGVPVEWVARSHFADLDYERQVEIVDVLAAEVMPHLPSD